VLGFFSENRPRGKMAFCRAPPGTRRDPGWRRRHSGVFTPYTSCILLRGSPTELANLAAEEALSGGVRDHWKRVLDITCIVLAFPGVLLLMLVIAVGINLVSPGPVFFKQERIGHRRKRFACLKFRTMKVGADTLSHQRHLKLLLQSGGRMTKMDAAGDPRVIPFGHFLRATGLDELPQLINVVRGEMSLVGPRPCTAYELESYLPWQHARFDALPGGKPFQGSRSSAAIRHASGVRYSVDCRLPHICPGVDFYGEPFAAYSREPEAGHSQAHVAVRFLVLERVAAQSNPGSTSDLRGKGDRSSAMRRTDVG
jgi:lipopolysaccharide/colanic/teichoic acid biosynthesis glycosyltransferase